jgi:DNA-binding GntR family transcriptional regulator
MASIEALFALSENEVLVETIRLHTRKTYAMRSITVNVPDILVQSRQEHWSIIHALEAATLTKSPTLPEPTRCPHGMPS